MVTCKKPFENFVGKGENNGLSKKNCTISATLKLFSANSFNLDKTKLVI